MTRYGQFFLALATVAAIASCSLPHRQSGAGMVATVHRIDTTLEHPVYSAAHDALIGLTGDHRLARIALPETNHDTDAETSVSDPLGPSASRALISPLGDDAAYVSEPDLGQVAELQLDDLQVSGYLPAGPAPSSLASDTGARTLLALSRDGSTVTPVDLHRRIALASTSVSAGPAALIEGAARGRTIDFHVLGPHGVDLYTAPHAPATRTGHLDIGASAAAGDRTKVSRTYIAENGTTRVLALDTSPQGTGLDIVGSVDVGEPVRHLAADDTRLYAVTQDKVIVLATQSFTGYADGTIPVVAALDFRTALPDGRPRSAAVSGIAVGDERLFLVLEGQPYVVTITAPAL